MFLQEQNNQPDLMAIRWYYTRWLIRMNSLVQIHTIFAKSYEFKRILRVANPYEFVWMTYTKPRP